MLFAVVLVSVALWIPTALYLQSPDRAAPLGNRGRFLFVTTAVVQSVVLMGALIVIFFARPGKTPSASRLTVWSGLIGYLAVPVWSYWLAFSLLKLNDEALILFWAGCGIFLIPAVSPRRLLWVRVGLGIVLSITMLLVYTVITSERSATTLIGPMTIYLVATLLSSTYAIVDRKRV
ncbi:hypothetical protein B7R22_18120 [Subtercola boreus]|uniref:Uncharacterized protein n=1 Tax=Subtercola boreus TaxID=120213 RepID=A0A3E0VQK3_9MICO|nr:hypothetical protein B7R22_18120 [Subtercola boreus]